MVSFVVRLNFASEDRTDMAATLALLATESRRESGCVSYIPHQFQDDPNSFLIYEQYRDPQALEAHRASEHFIKYAKNGLYTKVKERVLENLVALV